MNKFRVFAQILGVWALLAGLLWLSACSSENNIANTDKASETNKGDESQYEADKWLVEYRKTLDSTKAVYTLNVRKGTTTTLLSFDTLRAIGSSKYGSCWDNIAVPEIKIEADSNNANPLLRINETLRKFIEQNRRSPDELDRCDPGSPGIGNGFSGTFNVYRNDSKIFGVSTFGAVVTPCSYGWGEEYFFDTTTGERLKPETIFNEDFFPTLYKMLRSKQETNSYPRIPYLDYQLDEIKKHDKIEEVGLRLYPDSIVVVLKYGFHPDDDPPTGISFTIKEIKDLLRPEVFEKGWVKKD